VTNISEHLDQPMTIQQFAQEIMNHVLEVFPGARPYSFTEKDQQAIQKIRDEKYATHEWNYGYSPDYRFKKGIKTAGGILEIHMDVEKAVIQKVKIFGDFFNEKDISEIETALENVLHEEKAIRKVLAQFNINEYFRDMTADDLVEALF